MSSGLLKDSDVADDVVFGRGGRVEIYLKAVSVAGLGRGKETTDFGFCEQQLYCRTMLPVVDGAVAGLGIIVDG